MIEIYLSGVCLVFESIFNIFDYYCVLGVLYVYIYLCKVRDKVLGFISLEMMI